MMSLSHTSRSHPLQTQEKDMRRSAQRDKSEDDGRGTNINNGMSSTISTENDGGCGVGGRGMITQKKRKRCELVARDARCDTKVGDKEWSVNQVEREETECEARMSEEEEGVMQGVGDNVNGREELDKTPVIHHPERSLSFSRRGQPGSRAVFVRFAPGYKEVFQVAI
ncbi:hypothetical protein Pcinc_040342 [Petrolisthes cinctipes]|uniref:Uncharacterized protein n=1 Tax=Petrolisthes cinctipes TaxID=88211 RepID=A0AAE1BLQ3_PETCI|nr:hypothetical protein Pcinc_040342 [Petrolisthes cinctipes]